MFGYTMPLEYLLSEEERKTYRSYYCETCHQLKKWYGISSTMTLNYEMTFANIFLNSYLDDGTEIKDNIGKRFCVLRKPFAETELMKKLAGYSVLVANNAFVDNVEDGEKLKGNLELLIFSNAIKKAKRDYPEFEKIIMDDYMELVEIENKRIKDPIVLGTASSKSLIDVLKLVNTEKYNEDFEKFFRNIGIWVYVLDAIEDMDKDMLSGNYNPYTIDDNKFVNKRTYIQSHIFEIGETLGTITKNIQDSYGKMRDEIKINRNIIDNVIYRGIPSSSQRIIRGDETMSLSLKNMINGRMNRGLPPSLV